MSNPEHLLEDGLDEDSDYMLAEQIGFLLRRAHQRATSIFQSVFESQSLTPQQFAVLAKLFEVGEVTQNKLGRLVDMDPASLQGVIQRLQQKGFISRARDPLHKRRLKMQLTNEGREKVQRCFVLGKSVSELILQPLDQSGRCDLVRLLKMISHHES
ncbi:MAG: MarR family transcriptional regulator [Gammaproteobacteria bacterium]|nr:MarR family transcriptional regulator [Gammaproteobacteria bacterium]